MERLQNKYRKCQCGQTSNAKDINPDEILFKTETQKEIADTNGADRTKIVTSEDRQDHDQQKRRNEGQTHSTLNTTMKSKTRVT